MKNVKEAISMQIKDEKKQSKRRIFIPSHVPLVLICCNNQNKKKYFKFGIQFHSHISLLWDFCQNLNKMHASIYCCGKEFGYV